LVPVYLGQEYGLLHLAGKNNQPSQWLSLSQKQLTPFPHVIGSVKAMLSFKGGIKRLVEFYHGSGYLSQGSKPVFPEKGLEKVEYFDANGKSVKTIQLEEWSK
jgi:hypothetical protein